MKLSGSTPEEMQEEYYKRTANAFDSMHNPRCRDKSLEIILSLIQLNGISSILEVGCGTGIALKRFLGFGLTAVGLEPVPAMIRESLKKCPRQTMVRGIGECLPFADNSFDAVVAISVLHHVKEPRAIVNEMTRVARKAVFIADHNRFGAGAFPKRLVKLLLFKLGVWPIVKHIQTCGRGYTISDGDGVSFSYSVFDSYKQLSSWGSQTIIVPVLPREKGFHCVSGKSVTAMLSFRGFVLVSFREARPQNSSKPIKRFEALGLPEHIIQCDSRNHAEELGSQQVP